MCIDRTGKERDRTGWHCKAPPSPRPLDGLDPIAERPEAAVLVTECEKAADAAAAILPDLVCATSQGGSKVPGKSDWTPLRGRRLTIWPGNDESPASAMRRPWRRSRSRPAPCRCGASKSRPTGRPARIWRIRCRTV
jgi:hypothetical protein